MSCVPLALMMVQSIVNCGVSTGVSFKPIDVLLVVENKGSRRSLMKTAINYAGMIKMAMIERFLRMILS
jgi:hypothetical protein